MALLGSRVLSTNLLELSSSALPLAAPAAGRAEYEWGLQWSIDGLRVEHGGH